MADSVKRLATGRFIAKRGYCYYLYETMEAINADDTEVSKNLDRLQRNEPVFNRIYDGNWLTQSRRLADVIRADEHLKQFD